MKKIKIKILSAFDYTRLVSFFILVLLSAIIVSCQKVISIDLNSVYPQIVIEGNITNLPGPYFVRISRTVNFNDKNIFPVDSNAVVRISDTLGNAEQLKQLSPGLFSTTTLFGMPGMTYTLTVLTNGIEYRATSTMPLPVDIDSLQIVIDHEFRRDRKEIEATLLDPPGIHNYYRFITVTNGEIRNSYSLLNDRYTDGKVNIRNINAGDSTSILSGDTVTVFMHSIDEATYDYFRTLRAVSGEAGLGFLSASPANPITNFNNGALGYFSAYSVKSKTIIVP